MAQEPVMPEAEAQAPPPAEAPAVEENETQESNHEAPMGAFVFGFLLLAFYFIYFFAQWYEIVVLRGGA